MNEKMNSIIIKFAACLLVGLIAMLTYNAIAYEFNLPQFNYWIALGFVYTMRKIFH